MPFMDKTLHKNIVSIVKDMNRDKLYLRSDSVHYYKLLVVTV
jgi:hypothetical protein